MRFAWGSIVALAMFAGTPARAHETSHPISADLVARAWNTSEGLPQASALAIVQRSDGYLWFGTFKGLVRFDGAQFEVFDHHAYQGLPSSAIVRLLLDRRDRVWIGTDRGVAVMDASERITRVDVPGAPSGLIESIVEDGSGTIYISSSLKEPNTVRKITAVQEDRARDVSLPELAGESVHDNVTLVSSEGRVYAERGRAIYRLEANDRWEKVVELESEVFALGARRGGGVWASTAWAIFACDAEQRASKLVFNHAEKRPGDYGTLFESSRGELWSTSYTFGVFRYRDGLAPEHFSRKTGFVNDSTRFVFEDDEGTLWIGTDGAGLVSARRSIFTTYTDADGLSKNLVRAVLEEAEGDQQLWVGTYGGGVVRFDHGRFSGPVKTSNHEVSPNWVMALMRARDGAVWLGFYDDGVTRLQDGVIQQPIFPMDEVPTVRALAQTSDGAIYIGTSKGLFRTNGDGSKPVEEVALGPVHSATVLALLAHGDELWVGSEEHGLWRVDAAGHAELEERAPAMSAFTALAADHEGAVFAARDDGVLLRFHGTEVRQLGEEQGLPPAHYRALVDDGRGTMWIASNRGVFSFALVDLLRPLTPEHPLAVRIFDEATGLPNRDVSSVTRVSTSRADGGDLVFGTLGGLAILTPASLPAPGVAPRVRFVEVLLAGKNGAPARSRATSTAIEVPPGIASIELRFTSPTSISPELVRFDLEVDGPDFRSNHRLDRRSFQMLHPAPGTYRFRLMATNNDGTRAVTPATLEMELAPYYWQRWWFGSGVALLVAVVALVLVSMEFKSRLQRTQERRELFETTQALIWSLDGAGRFAMMSASVQQIYGRAPEELIGRSFAELSKDRAADEAFLASLKREPRSVDHWSVHLRADGSEVHLRFKAIARKNKAGEVIGFAGTAMDVTDEQLARAEKERVEKQLRETQKLESLGLLAGGIAHDFNNLLTTTMLNIDFLKNGDAPMDTDATEAVQAIELVSQRASELCKQMLAYSGRGRFELKPLDLNELADSTARLVRPAAAKDVRFDLQLEARPAMVVADAGQMGQVVMNLLLNGAEAIGKRAGLLVVRTAVRSGSEAIFRDAVVAPRAPNAKFLVFSVTDDGCGMSRETVARIFEPFFSTKSTGRGLGLSAVLGIVRGHAGALRVLSEVDRGTTFEVWLPAAELSAAEAVAPAKALPELVRGDALVVDDEAAIRSSLTRILGRRGVRVVQAENGSEALQRFEPGRFEVVFLDLTMPVMGGLEALKLIHERAPEQCVVLMSGYDASDVTGAGPGATAFSFMSKPFRVEDIDRILEEARARKSATRSA